MSTADVTDTTASSVVLDLTHRRLNNSSTSSYTLFSPHEPSSTAPTTPEPDCQILSHDSAPRQSSSEGSLSPLHPLAQFPKHLTITAVPPTPPQHVDRPLQSPQPEIEDYQANHVFFPYQDLHESNAETHGSRRSSISSQSSTSSDATTSSSRARERRRRAARARRYGMQELNYWYPYYPPVQAQQRYGIPPSNGYATSYGTPFNIPPVPNSETYYGSRQAPSSYPNIMPTSSHSTSHSVHFQPTAPHTMSTSGAPLYSHGLSPYYPDPELAPRVRSHSNYSHAADAAGLGSIQSRNPYAFSGDSSSPTPFTPSWTIFSLKVYRGRYEITLVVKPHWDDEKLLRKLSMAYDALRSWRKWFSLRDIGEVSWVRADDKYIYPLHVHGVEASISQQLRWRWYLRHPETLRGKQDFVKALTQNDDYGIEIKERWDIWRIAILIGILIAASLATAVVYSVYTGDVSSGFAIAGYMTSAYSVCLVLIGVLNLVQF